jgi:dsRNA-specific ribonuclease
MEKLSGTWKGDKFVAFVLQEVLFLYRRLSEDEISRMK